MTPVERLVDAVKNARVDDVVHLLLFETPDPDTRDEHGCPILFLAARAGHLDMVETLLQFGADPNLATEQEKATPLHAACLHGHAPVAVLLLDNDAPVNAKDKDGDTPLHLTAHEGLLTLCEFLVQRKANVLAENNDGKTPRQLAAEWLTPNYLALHPIFSEVLEFLQRAEAAQLGKPPQVTDAKDSAAFKKNAAALKKTAGPGFFPPGPRP